ncbi:MAG: hypothetical protein KF895_03065 [Parvibaculum sp.]|nr:hypothetical protein [Parvibaculum sp.]
MAQRKRGAVPRYWWDISGNEIIIETDDPRCPPVIDRLPLPEGDCHNVFDKACEIVADWKAGRRKWTGDSMEDLL